jgi:hypothetical protein
MELFIPTLLVLVLAAVVCFVFLPRMSPYTLGMLSFGFLAVGVWQHYSLFPYEYQTARLGMYLSDYAPFIMAGAVVLGGMIAVMLTFGGNPPSIAAVTNSLPAMPALPNIGASLRPANNKGASILNNAKRTVNNLASSSFKTV